MILLSKFFFPTLKHRLEHRKLISCHVNVVHWEIPEFVFNCNGLATVQQFAASLKLLPTSAGPPGRLQHHRGPRRPEPGRRRGQEVVPHRHLHQGGTVGAQLGRSGRSRPDRPPGQRQEMRPTHPPAVVTSACVSSDCLHYSCLDGGSLLYIHASET